MSTVFVVRESSNPRGSMIGHMYAKRMLLGVASTVNVAKRLGAESVGTIADKMTWTDTGYGALTGTWQPVSGDLQAIHIEPCIVATTQSREFGD